MKGWQANRDLFLDKEEKVVEAGDPTAAFLLAREGKTIPQERMDRYDVKKTKPSKAEAEEQVAEAPEAEKKPPKAKKKTEDKAVKGTEDKNG